MVQSTAPKNLKRGPKGLFYTIFSHRFIVVFVVVATTAMLIQVVLMSEALAINLRGANALNAITSRADQENNLTLDLESEQALMEAYQDDINRSTAGQQGMYMQGLAVTDSEKAAADAAAAAAALVTSEGKGGNKTSAESNSTLDISKSMAAPAKNSTPSAAPASNMSVAPQEKAPMAKGPSPPAPASMTTENELTITFESLIGELQRQVDAQVANTETKVTATRRSEDGLRWHRAMRRKWTGVVGQPLQKRSDDDDDKEEEDDADDDDENSVQSIGKLLSVDRSNFSTTFVTGTSWDGVTYNLTLLCAEALILPSRTLHRSHRTDLVLVLFQVWVWGLAFWGLVLESVPHLGAVIFSHLLNATFGGFQVVQTDKLHYRFDKTITQEICSGLDMLPDFWSQVIILQRLALGLEIATFLGMLILCWKLYSVLDWRTFKKIGASRRARVAHSLSMLFTICLHLDAFFVIAFQVIWLTELSHHGWEDNSSQLAMPFKTILTVLIALTLPWVYLGFRALRKESRLGVALFALFDLILFASNMFLLSGKLYQTVATDWAFLKFMGVLSSTLLVLTVVVAVGTLFMFRGEGLLDETLSSRSSGGIDSSLEKRPTEPNVAFPGEVVAFSVQTFPWQQPPGRGAGASLPPINTALTNQLPPSYAVAEQPGRQGVPADPRRSSMASWTLGDEGALAANRRSLGRAPSERTISTISYSTTSVGSVRQGR